MSKKIFIFDVIERCSGYRKREEIVEQDKFNALEKIKAKYNYDEKFYEFSFVEVKDYYKAMKEKFPWKYYQGNAHRSQIIRVVGVAKVSSTGEESRLVYLNGEILPPDRSLELINHSPDGFNWGYEGSGPAQLALAILLELVPEEQAIQDYQTFKRHVIAKLPMNKDFAIEFRKGVLNDINHFTI